MQENKENKNLPILTEKEQRQLDIIMGSQLNELHDFIQMTTLGKMNERDQRFGTFSLERVINSIGKSLVISSVKKYYPEKANIYIKQMIFNFCVQLNFERTLTPQNIEEITSYFQNNLYFYTFQDIHLFLEMFKKGELYNDRGEKIKMYGGINILLFYEALAAYEKQRHEYIINSKDNYTREVGQTTINGKNIFKNAKKQLQDNEIKAQIKSSQRNIKKQNKRK